MRRTTHTRFRIAIVGLAIASAAVLGYPMSAHAESIYKCRGAEGAVVFQDRACRSTQAESVVEIMPAPTPAESPDYGRAAEGERGARSHSVASPHGNAKPRHEAMSYECRAANGDVFYRHAACPRQIPAKDAVSASNSRSRAAKGKQGYAVSGQSLPRSEACRRIASGGARDGHERDDRVSTYDHNLGRDPCRYL